MKVSLVLGLAVALIAAPVWGQEHDPFAAGRFHVTWEPRPYGAPGMIEGHVHNDSMARVANVRVEVEGLAADHHLVGRKLAWVIGDIVPGGETYFVVESLPGAVTYRIDVVSFNVVSGGVEAP
jgi:hypothetical protein